MSPAEGPTHSLAVTWDPNPTRGSHIVDGGESANQAQLQWDQDIDFALLWHLSYPVLCLERNAIQMATAWH